MQSDNLDDSFIQDLFSEFGATGYMVYFGIISLICKENKNKLTGRAEFSSSFLKQKLHVSPVKLQEILGFCEGKGKLLFSFSDKKFNLDFPKMLEIKDNYTKDLQVTTKNVSNHKEVEVDTKDKEEDIKPIARPKKKPNPERVKTSLDRHHDLFLEKFGIKPVINGKQATLMARLEKSHGREKIFTLLDSFFQSTDKFIMDGGFTVEIFNSQINKLIANGSGNGQMTQLEKDRAYYKKISGATK